MSNLIPRIEFGGSGVALSLTGDTTISNNTITNITDTDGTLVGQILEGSGIPTGTTVSSLTATTIVMSANATASAVGVSLTLFTRITFEFPPQGDNLRERVRGNVKRAISTGGKSQHQFNFNESVIAPNFVFVTQALIDSLRTFYEDHASRGFEFKYFESSDEATFFTMELNRFEFQPQRVIPTNTPGEFIHDLSLSLRRTL